MLNFISFGSGSCGNCYYIYTETYGILIDIGIGIRKLKKYFHDYGLNVKDVKYILVTHDHADHVKSVGSFSNSLNIPVYATKEVHEGIRCNYCVRKKIDAANIRIIEKGKDFVLDDFTVSAFNVPHDSRDNIGFKIKYEDVNFCLMTDIGHVTDEMAQVIREADYLVIEANHDEDMLRNGPYSEYLKKRVSGGNGHLSNRLCAKYLADNDTSRLRHVWLCHLSQENNHPELARKTVEMGLTSSDNRKIDSLELDVLKRNSPSGAYKLK
ncbi:MBL fold metallo-hydrolase [uncultured Prevotella sp.]|uniref:MBL fold metallo-hydrolase n=1 Tax=uncultured Prevotella sp. TaxID=159272 RepID=UPI0025DF21CA|nr:MBL fold metallo-hydrolase [uncultured Prevotella sp.]